MKISQKVWLTYDIWICMCIRKINSYISSKFFLECEWFWHIPDDSFYLWRIKKMFFRFNGNSKILRENSFENCLVYVLTRDYSFLWYLSYLFVIVLVCMYVKLCTLKFFSIFLKYYCNLLNFLINSQTINSLV